MPYANGDYALSKQIISCDDPANWIRNLEVVPNATVERLQSRTAFDAYGEMELAATADQTTSLVDRVGQHGVLVVTEDRSRPIRMRRHLPQYWATSRSPDSLAHFDTAVAPGENLHFQVALFAPSKDVSITRVKFSDDLSSLSPHCLNLEGFDYWGRPYSPPDASKRVAKGTIRSFYMMTTVPTNAMAGTVYKGNVTLISATGTMYTVSVQILVTKRPFLENGGDNERYRNTRLAWLDSKLGLGNHQLPSPFTPIQLNEPRVVSMLGKQVTICPRIREPVCK